MVWREIHQVPQAQADHRDPARRQHRPLRRAEDRRAVDGRCDHHRRHPRARATARPTAQYLPHPHDRDHLVVGISRRHGRLHQDLPPQQGGTQRPLQDSRTDRHRTHRGPRALVVARREDEREPRHRTPRPGDGRQAPGQGHQVAQDHHTLCQGSQPRLLAHHGLLRQVQDRRRLDTVRGDDHPCGDCREQRCQPQRRHGRHVRRQLGHHRRGARHTGLRQFAHRVCRLPQHHVYTRVTGTGGIPLRLCRRAHRISLVQRLPRTGVHGRHWIADHRRHHRRDSHHHTQGTHVAHTLRHLLCREPERHPASVLLQDRQAPRREATHLQAHPHTRQLPHPAVATRPRVQVSLPQA